ncbi:hypothetical protein G6F35_016805 [Rhizopus arrhizus]|nr:hypothetical protein G6F35_016805 [Rhizopus arrhizus]
MDRRQLPGQRGQPARGGRWQLRGGRPQRWPPADHRRGRLFGRRAYAVRRCHPHGAVHPVPGGNAGLGGAQGLRHPHPRGLLHRQHRLHQAQGAGPLRWRYGRTG